MISLYEVFKTRESNGLEALLWCLPALMVFFLMFAVLPFYSHVPLLPNLLLVDVFFVWFLFVAPVTTVKAMRVLNRTPRVGVVYWVARVAIAVSVLANILVLISRFG